MQDTMRMARQNWAEIAGEIEGLFAQLWAVPELPAMEFTSSDILCSFMERHGIAVERGAFGIPTAFVASVIHGQGPRVGILVEYDALPALYNDAVPYRQGNRRKPGHGCGHNHIGPVNTGAGIAAIKTMKTLSLPGEIRIIGCPAEEIGWGKLALQAAGAFDGLDVIITSHGDYQNGSLARPCHSMASGEFRFTGVSAHGGKVATRNALETAEAAFAAFVRIKDEIPGLQLKHVYRDAGITPGVTPEEVRLWASVRHPDFTVVSEGYRKMEETFRTIAGERNVDFCAEQIASCRGYLGNDTVGRVLDDCIREVGPPRWTDDDITWMTELSSACDPGAPFDLHREIDYFDTGIDYYGQDDGNVSWVVPLGRVNWAYPNNVPIHHWAWTALSGHSSSSPGALMASETLAMAAVRLLASPKTVEAAKSELQARVEDRIITPPAPTITDVLVKDPQSFWDATWSR
ncbi:amidohydrolase [Rhizobium sp. CG5]|uniref:amidohydrolase n=1 Tax=Rhizobium sp. CG5 TaxID=2726076 RepID=UPI00203477D9|nr:amidohydrolase [Rhizobium sp. CG5]MCM2473438.1 amidohydrolase [Rhizobium sp. CG5]